VDGFTRFTVSSFTSDITRIHPRMCLLGVSLKNGTEMATKMLGKLEFKLATNCTVYTDFDYADDVVLMAEQTETLRSALLEFHQIAANLGLHLSSQKTKVTKVQNLDSGDPAADMASNTVEAVREFRYLGSIQSSSGRCHRDYDYADDAVSPTGLICHALDTAQLATTAATLPKLCSSNPVARC